MAAKKSGSPSTIQAAGFRKTLARKNIAVYADWEEGKPPFKLGTLTAHAGGGKETFAFEFDAEALAHGELQAVVLDPDLRPHAGPQYCLPGRPNFGLFMDASPDRWGRLLMKRRLDRDKRKGLASNEQRLVESDSCWACMTDTVWGRFDFDWTMLARFWTTTKTRLHRLWCNCANWSRQALLWKRIRQSVINVSMNG
jgi:hypothetical protein